MHLTNGFEMRSGIGEEKLNSMADVDDEKINWYCPVAYSLTLAKLQIWKFFNGKFRLDAKSNLDPNCSAPLFSCSFHFKGCLTTVVMGMIVLRTKLESHQGSRIL